MIICFIVEATSPPRHMDSHDHRRYGAAIHHEHDLLHGLAVKLLFRLLGALLVWECCPRVPEQQYSSLPASPMFLGHLALHANGIGRAGQGPGTVTIAQTTGSGPGDERRTDW